MVLIVGVLMTLGMCGCVERVVGGVLVGAYGVWLTMPGLIFECWTVGVEWRVWVELVGLDEVLMVVFEDDELVASLISWRTCWALWLRGPVCPKRYGFDWRLDGRKGGGGLLDLGMAMWVVGVVS